MIERYFAIDMPFWRFSFNTLVVSCLWLIPLLLLYVSLTPGFGSMLIGNGMALGLFLRQVLTDGLAVVFVVNYLGFFLYGALAETRGRDGAASVVLLADPPLRILIFILLHGMVYFLSADWFGSFGGDHWLALRVVGPTLTRSALFGNLEGVYFYATLGSALPVYVDAIGRLRAQGAGRGTWVEALANLLPERSASLFLAVCLFAVCALLLTGAAWAIVFLQAA